MGYDPNEPRDMQGRWSHGAATIGHRSKGNASLIDRISTQHQRDTALAVAKGAARGIAEGVVLSAVVGAATGGYGSLAAPALIGRAVVRGAIEGARLHPVHAALAAGVGAAGGLAAHKERMKVAVHSQHKKG